MTLGGYRHGDAVPDHERSPSAIGNRSLHQLGPDEALFVEEVQPGDLEEFRTRAVSADARVLPVVRNRSGERERMWAVMPAAVAPEEFGEELGTQRTAGLCTNFIAQEGMGADGHHERFRTVFRLDPQKCGVQEHHQATQYLKALLLVDQYGGANSVGIKMVQRRMQMIEFAHAERAKENEAKGVGGRRWRYRVRSPAPAGRSRR